MTDSELIVLLEDRHTAKLYWEAPYDALLKGGQKSFATVEHSATVHDCINIQRLSNTLKGAPDNISDKDTLMDFIIVNYAYNRHNNV